MTAKLYIDQDHNALGIIEDHPDGVITIDHGICSEDFDRVLAIMERHGRSRFVGEGMAHAASTAYPNTTCGPGLIGNRIRYLRVLLLPAVNTPRPLSSSIAATYTGVMSLF